MLKRCSPLQKQLAIATGTDPSVISRQVNGELPSPLSRFSDFIRQCSVSGKADPSAALLHCHMVAARTLTDFHGLRLGRLLERALRQKALQRAPAEIAEIDYLIGNCPLEELRERYVDVGVATIRAITVMDAINMKTQEAV